MNKLFELAKKYEGKEPPNVISLGNMPIAYPGLTLFYGLSGSFKSYSSVIMASKQNYDGVYYLDFEGNSVDLKTHCLKHNVFYINMAIGSDTDLELFLTEIAKLSSDYKLLVIVDSFSRVFQVAVNETEKIDKIFKKLKIEPTNNNYSLLIIDHARKNDVYGVDIRGGDNKKKFADMVLKVNKADYKSMICDIEIEKSRIPSIKPRTENIQIKLNNKSTYDEFVEIIILKGIPQNKRELRDKLSKKQREIYKEFINDYDNIKNKIKKDLYE